MARATDWILPTEVGGAGFRASESHEALEALTPLGATPGARL
jgi:hypothetical protein